MEKKISLRKDTDFQRVYKKNDAFFNRDFTVLIKNNGLNHPRFGFSIGKKVGKANQRNFLKRRDLPSYQKNERCRGVWLLTIRCVSKQETLRTLCTLFHGGL